MEIIGRVGEMIAFSKTAKKKGKTIAFVPTMGCLHAGHIALVNKARTLGNMVILSVFVNPLQFGPKEDYETYPRDLKKDMELSSANRVDVFFNPAPDEMYPKGCSTSVEVDNLSDKLCGASRPGHFRGVLTVVAKLFNIIGPDFAVFGMKDYQQQLLIKKMVKDLNIGVKVATVETIREPDGLAMSSRNGYLSKKERIAATVIPRSLDRAIEAFSKGERRSIKVIGEVKKVMDTEPLVMVDYIKVCDTETLDGMDNITDKALLAIAVKIGNTRLIDNRMLQGGL